MVKIDTKKKRIVGLILILSLLIPSILVNLIPNNSTTNSTDQTGKSSEDAIEKDENLKTSLPPITYGWWNVSWDFRIPISISSTDDQVDAPVELFINFTEYLNDIGVTNPWLDNKSIRVIEYESSSNYWEVACEFEPYIRIYNDESNAVGDVIWILNGSTSVGTTRDFFIYFNNGSVSKVFPTNYYTNLRLWHEGFETYYIGDITGGISGQDTFPTSGYWEVSNITSSRGQSSLHIWGNCWKSEALPTFSTSIKVTAKMRFDDPDVDREVSGIGFHDRISSIPAPENSYNIRGNQVWGSAENYKYRNQYYAANTFFWYTLSYIAYDEYVFYIADDDSYTNRDLYWDDISVWDTSISDVQTVPDNMLHITTGDLEPATFRLEVTCLDEDGTPVPGASVYISNMTQPELDDEAVSDSLGVASFIDLVKEGIYNITVNYTQNGLASPNTETVFIENEYTIDILNNILTANLNLSTYYFNVKDNDADPIKYGFVNLIDDVSTDVVGKGTLDGIGNTTLRWLNSSTYDYEVYFDYNSLPDISTYFEPELRIIDSTSVSGTFINVLTDISKVTFNVTEETTDDPFVNAKIRVTNRTGGESIANVTSLSDGSATFISFGQGHGSWGEYKFDIFFAGQPRSFKVNDTTGLISDYDFNLNIEYNINISINLDSSGFNCTYFDVSYTSQILWGETFSITFNFTYTEPGLGHISVAPDEMFIQILDGELDPFSQKLSILGDLTPLGPVGLYNYTFATTEFSLIGDTYYFIEFTGNYLSYVAANLQEQIYIIPLATAMNVYDYSFNPITEISGFYGEKINVTVRYEDTSNNALQGARVSYEWRSDPITIVSSGDVNPDLRDSDYYTFELDLSLADADTYLFEISAILENYTTQEIFYFLNVKPRTTAINGVEKLLLLTRSIFVTVAQNFTFEYNDTLVDPSQRIGNLDKFSYFWYKLDDDGNPIGEPSEDINLITTVDNKYILDFDTATKTVGSYKLIATLEKQNYEPSSAIIDLTIEKRIFDYDLSATGLKDDQLNIVKGKEVEIEIELVDDITGEKITGADVVLDIGGKEYEFDEDSDGVYTYTFSTKEYEAFYSSQTLTGEIIIKKENYDTETVDITIVIEMEEVTEGVPTFYFIMAVAAIAAVVGSLGAYRYIQVARIPTFVKKARKVKKSIKSGDIISEALLYPSKEEYLVKALDAKYSALGLSLDDLLGLKGKRKSDDTLKKNGGVK